MGNHSCKVAVLMTCHNRRDTTLACLRALKVSCNAAKDGFCGGLEVSVFLVDDGSTDSTRDAVSAEFPHVRIIQGTGNLFWARGMNLAWQVARSERIMHDCYVWLNDDVVMAEDGLDILLRSCWLEDSCSFQNVVVAGACQASDGTCIYGAVDEKYVILDPRTVSDLSGHWMTGNVVAVPRKVCEKVGIISDEYSHGRADYDYAERLRIAGVPVQSSRGIVGTCDYNFDPKMRGVTKRERFVRLFRPGYWNLHDLWLFRIKYYGWPHAIVSCAHHILNALRG